MMQVTQLRLFRTCVASLLQSKGGIRWAFALSDNTERDKRPMVSIGTM